MDTMATQSSIKIKSECQPWNKLYRISEYDKVVVN